MIYTKMASDKIKSNVSIGVYNQEKVHYCNVCMSLAITVVNDYGVYACKDCGNYYGMKTTSIFKYLEAKEMLEILNEGL